MSINPMELTDEYSENYVFQPSQSFYVSNNTITATSYPDKISRVFEKEKKIFHIASDTIVSQERYDQQVTQAYLTSVNKTARRIQYYRPSDQDQGSLDELINKMEKISFKKLYKEYKPKLQDNSVTENGTTIEFRSVRETMQIFFK